MTRRPISHDRRARNAIRRRARRWAAVAAGSVALTGATLVPAAHALPTMTTSVRPSASRVATLAPDDTTLRLGDVGPAVASWQRQLNMIGADLRIDGIYGASTEDSTLAFQRFFGLPATGAADPGTRGFAQFLLALSRQLTAIATYPAPGPPYAVVGYPSEQGYCLEVRADTDIAAACGPVLDRALEVRDIEVDGFVATAGLVSSNVTRVRVEPRTAAPYDAELVALQGIVGPRAFASPDAASDIAVVRAYDSNGAEIGTVVRSDGQFFFLLAYGDRGQPVLEWQAALNRLGADLAEDGIFGRRTEEVTMAIQAFFGLQVDGIVGPETRELVEALLALVGPAGGA